VLYSFLALLAVGYLVIPIYLGLSNVQTDMIASVLLALATGAVLYETHLGSVPTAILVRSVLICFFAVLFVTIAVLWNGIRFQALIPINGVLCGVAYWYLSKHRTSASDCK
jgi:hypothetical protein